MEKTIKFNLKNKSSERTKSSEEIKKNVINLEEFPVLKKPNKHQNTKSNSITVNNKVQQSSWLTVVSSKPNKNSPKEAFPVLSSFSSDKKEKTSRVEGNLNSLPRVTNLGVLKSEEPKKSENVQPKNKTKSKNLSKNSAVPSVRNPNKKKRADPIFIDFNEILQAGNVHKKEKQPKNTKTKFQRRINKEQLSGNYLDSSNPKRCKGKHREIKKRKFSNLKLTIIKERVVKQKMREKALNLYLGKECSNLENEIDFKVEINKYLDNLSKRKINNKEVGKSDASEICDVSLDTEIKIKPEEKSNKDNHKPEEIVPYEDKSHPKQVLQKKTQFSSKLREYCDNLVTPELNSAVTVFIKELVNLQDKLFARDAIKAKTRKRHVSGLREVKKYLTLKKIKMIIIAPNLEKLQMEGSIYDIINNLKKEAEGQKVPCVFALDRYKLGRCTKKNVPVSAFGVLNYEGIENLFENVLHHLTIAKDRFLEMFKPMSKTEEDEKIDKAKEVTSQVVSSFISIFRENLSLNENENEV